MISSKASCLFAAVLTLAALPARAEAPFTFAATPGKLPKDVVPVQYAAHLKPDLAANTFLGSETIEIDVLRPTSTIMLNAADIEIDAASLSDKRIGEVKLTPLLDKEQQTLSFKLAAPLVPGRYQLALKFHGKINREARGLFHMNYQLGKDDKRMLATLMQPSDARRLLPTWDEPAFRATFKLTVDVPASFQAYSNTPVEKNEKIDGGKQRISFAVTPKMPSYLFVLVAGELERVAARQDGVDIGVVTTAGKGASAAYALGATKDLLRYFNGYFGMPYPLPKLDQIAIPGGFAGAMENWGGIVYNDASLLVDPKTSPESTRQQSFGINAHELAHQWFGNLVTMAWWDNLWLNEGFASWMSTKAVEHFHPEWRAHLAALAEREDVMNLDARAATHPVQMPILNEEQAADAFDSITYVKGEAFLRMLEAYLGEEPFRKGIRAYLQKHQYSNTTSADLWSALEKASGKPVAALASDWTTQPGFPLVKVAQSCEGGRRKVTLSQEQFRLDQPATEKRLWHVPVQYGVVGGKASYTLLSGPTGTFYQPSCDGALVIDPHGVGYYRVQYERSGFEHLAAQAPRLPDASRLKLVSDTWSLVMADRLPLASYLALAGRYADEPRLAIWQTMLGNLGTLDTLALGQAERPMVRRFMINLAGPRIRKLGWNEKPGESGEDRQLRATLALALAQAGDPGAIAEGRARFARYLNDPASVPPSLLDFAMNVAGRYADAATYEQLYKRLLQTRSDEERRRLASALALVQDPALAERTMQLALKSDLPPIITSTLVAEVAAAGHAEQAWRFSVANREALMKDQESIAINRMLPRLVSNSSDTALAETLQRYVRANFGPDAQVEADRVANGVRTRAALKARLLPQVRKVLQPS